MNREQYLAQLVADGDLVTQLRVHAEEHLGPCGQSETVLRANQIKRDALLKAAGEIGRLTELCAAYDKAEGRNIQMIGELTDQIGGSVCHHGPRSDTTRLGPPSPINYASTSRLVLVYLGTS